MTSRGFILVEVLITLVISSMLTGILFLTMQQVSVGVRAVDEVIDLHTQAIVATRQLERDIAGAMLVHDMKKNFFSEQQDDNSMLLTFITNNPLQQWQSSAGTPRLVRVTYKLVPDKSVGKNVGKRYTLTRQESMELPFDKAGDDTHKARAYTLIDEVIQFKTLYTAAKTDEKKPQKDAKPIAAWDSDSVGDDGKKREPDQMLPVMVTIALELANGAKNKQTFTCVIPLIPDMIPHKQVTSEGASQAPKTDKK
ncbi:hypothetical protein JST99_02180 [Candidatus Dependentiae bacterium]|nr:hypothetical protein [Candidatus Dependentiae bacterium]MCC7415485.1 hypothetical protein [Campylobacterota bacterium]